MFEDKEIKNLIIYYQRNGAGFQKIKEVLAEFIYHFPSIGFDVHDEDKKGDFYLYASERLENVLKKYQIQEKASFKTYFYLVLRRQYLNFIQNSSQNSKETPVDLEESFVYWEEDFPEKKFRLEQVSMIFASLSPRDRLILKLRCPEFLLPGDIRELASLFQYSPSYLLSRIDIIFNDLATRERKSKRGSAVHLVVTSPRAIAEFLDIKAQLVSKWIFNIRKAVQEKMGEAHVS